ncbi:helix-turn-helix transcriptional regulator [Priestia sp. SB1]|uniref:helix-turn-helix domain-containing protein n=1 Tax=Priestia sp. SB1 TaxID=3132359 RepID=UPI0031804D96
MNQLKDNQNSDKRPPRNEGEENILGNRIKELRDIKGLSTGKIAKLIGKTKASVVGYEQGYRFPLLRDIHLLAEVLDTSVAYLIGETDIPGRPLTLDTIKPLSELIEEGDFHRAGKALTPEQLEKLIAHMKDLTNTDAEDRDDQKENGDTTEEKA